mmetsp:Transcript_27701/g.94549  ORF Transcript_27701/g.94549 Transcript_27701/m.94549 type:complete len:246 (-) Transcript_27701:88-825(-)
MCRPWSTTWASSSRWRWGRETWSCCTGRTCTRATQTPARGAGTRTRCTTSTRARRGPRTTGCRGLRACRSGPWSEQSRGRAEGGRGECRAHSAAPLLSPSSLLTSSQASSCCSLSLATASSSPYTTFSSLGTSVGLGPEVSMSASSQLIGPPCPGCLRRCLSFRSSWCGARRCTRLATAPAMGSGRSAHASASTAANHSLRACMHAGLRSARATACCVAPPPPDASTRGAPPARCAYTSPSQWPA